MRTTNFDAIATSAPLNREASVVRDGSGDLYSMEIASQIAHWSAPPLPTGHPKPPEWPDLTGKTWGRLRVVRFHGKGGPGKHAKLVWLVRCSCGDYETRTHDTAMKAANPDDACVPCARFIQMSKNRKSSPRKDAAALRRILSKAGVSA